jgi:enoyl-CoA hydratase
MASMMNLETLAVGLAGGIATIEFNRPEKANAMSLQVWQDLRAALRWVDETADARVAVLSGRGRSFTAGIDVALLAGLRQEIASDCEGRTRERLRRLILDLQDALTSIERCRKPVLAAIHGACIGAGVDLITCCDMRYASSDASFSIREIDVGMTADVGTLQRLPKIVPQGIARELAYTGRKFDAAEARAIGLVDRVYESHEALRSGVGEIAAAIAAKSPLAIRGIKKMMLYARDHSVADALDYVATWNAAMLLSKDLEEAIRAGAQKRTPRFMD